MASSSLNAEVPDSLDSSSKSKSAQKYKIAVTKNCNAIQKPQSKVKSGKTAKKKKMSVAEDDDYLFHKKFVDYCLRKGLSLKWVENSVKAELERRWKELNEEVRLVEMIKCKRDMKKVAFDKYIYEALGECYEKNVIRTRYR